MAVMGAAPRFPVSRKAAKGRAADSRQVGAGFLVIRRRGHRTSMRADSRERPLHQVANVCTRLVPAIPSSQVTGRLWPVASGFRFNSGFHCSIETDEPVGPHFQQQIPDTPFLPALRNCGRRLPRSFLDDHGLRRLLAAAKPTGTVDDCGARRGADAGSTRRRSATLAGPHFMYHLRSDSHHFE